MPRLLKHVPSGDLYIWDPIFAERGDFEEVFEGAAPPKEPKTKRKQAIAVDVPEPEVDDPELKEILQGAVQ